MIIALMATTKEQRDRIVKQQGITCYLCGKKTTKRERQIDHVIPQAKGGSDCDSNLRTSCKKCNRAKSDLDINDYITKKLVELRLHLDTLEKLEHTIKDTQNDGKGF